MQNQWVDYKYQVFIGQMGMSDVFCKIDIRSDIFISDK